MMIEQIENITGQEVIAIDRATMIDSLIELCEAYKREAEAKNEAMQMWYRRAIEAEEKLRAVENIQTHAHALKAGGEEPFRKKRHILKPKSKSDDEERRLILRTKAFSQRSEQEKRWDNLIKEAKEKGLLAEDDERHLSDITFNISER